MGARGLWLVIARLCACALAGVIFTGAGQARAADAIRPKVCIARAVPGQTPSEMFAKRDWNCSEEQTAYGPGDYWARMDGFAASSPTGDQLVLRLVSMWQESASVYFRYADGRLERRDYAAANAAPYFTVGAMFEIPAPWRTQAVTGILIHVQNSGNVRGIVLGPELSTKSAAARQRGSWIALYAGFAGVAFTLFIYNLALWAAMRHRFQLIYCGMLAGMTVYIFSASGALLLAFPDAGNNFRLQFSYALLALTALSALLFTRDFFGKSIVTPRVRLLVNVSAAALVVTTISALIVAHLSIAYFTTVYYAGYLPGIAALTVISASALRKKTPFARMFLLAWGWPLLAGALRWLHGVGLIPYSFWLDNSSILAFAIEAMVSSAVIAMRIRALSQERDRARAEESVARDLARIDPLTGLLNRRGFLDQAIGQPGEQQLIILDIDHFKAINDTHGHDCGDDVLRHFALTLRKWSPDSALVARIGGEEFAVLIPSAAYGAHAAERLLDLVRSAAMPRGIRVTSSLGIAQGPLASEQDWQLLYRRADAALYRAKRDGRDRVCVSTSFAKAA